MLLPDISYAIFVLIFLVKKSQQHNDAFHVVTGLPPGNEYLIAEKEITRSEIHCANWCAMTATCNSAVFNSTTMHCGLYRESQSANNSSSLEKQLILQRDETENIETTVSGITRENTTKIVMTSERATFSVTTSERTTNHGTTMEKLTSQKPTSNGLNMTSQRATISGTTSERTTNHGTTMEKLTSQKPTSNGLDCSGVTVGSSSGVYTIYVDNQPLDVYCEMTSSGQWTVFQRRIDGSTDFYRTWQEYKQGFGNVNSEYWLGNDNLHKILSTGNYKLRVDLEDWAGKMRYAEYDTFVVGNEATNYVLTIANYNGTAGDSLTTAQQLSYQPNGYGFSTLGRDNDASPFMNCAEVEHAGWWFNWCTTGNLNGKYYNGGVIESDGIYWEAWKLSQYSLRNVSMKIKQA
ncbi:Angiopoietin-related protein 1,Fibrinogen gamma-B chain,Ficolin-1-A,Angiopoietin-1,Fibrinogen C domain-containing protein 1,Ryncolin-1,Tenascin-N,Angiopoietin-related protein 7,Angiopoietin-related protein 6,Ficolin-3,Fibroleukin,Fibrinogen-like protein 1,Ficolin-1,Ficolin-1-B,Fibrinogen beta chain,Angiopoietin-4,Tenascin-R,Ryncolin-2,Techylectin-5B,Fibrinogen C domain-containing protein 1-A,Microfibril-associated glycoprotein 4,Ryncolin-3,Fibrinogen gamma chain,Tenascin-X,Ficolin-2,Fibrinogen alpha chain|uniref:Fibrinogen C-terminal domain-containing protein n=1 Tax=Mytilus edulis TaxID=6550 RepID=A0A8S3TUW7_MYTED|nr:Angiopoietin-related protein 1,Fibrinogen gamma-B chain,Ficolin-1-A,Angiopoietin-1,Fibrinogen C domain-containing protein 1,Ryncolin-1,Tenascin-N,Angiopoietin-related protein 7,Angiopoietin-related protein 6,Ficolin-3,Fibroleukin,Fibrinogen-like protein 1,Ficolin-1,Ficolin-1-B,Fibrinogen beta chain,Angiopoietin-4,Tenascin-R,Ryncolin-2,Techylectin-5B,Fibrinogen C domain-containing protein 1-A,Microfibril-associated glycoprotein 4,Ryncolin-3,Fibrinogen gamma chain,Tenascin-X,Ficolin-2,Fibrinogen a